MTEFRILVTDGDARTALAAVRSLGAAGHNVHVTAAGQRSLAGCSRFATAEHVVPDAADSPKDWANAIEDIARKIGADLIIPITEVSLGTVYEMELVNRWTVACPPRVSYELAVDKHDLMLRAASLGIDVPRSELISSPSELTDLPETMTYPVVLKARRSRFLRDGKWNSGEVRLVHDAKELRRVAIEPGFRAGALLQEFVPGHGEAIFLLAQKGRTLASFAHRRLREKPPTGGVSVLRESITPDRNLLESSERLLEALNWTGVAMIEFRRVPRGQGVLMEINPRLWGSLQLAIDAGVDFPNLLVALYRGQTVEPTPSQIGVRCRWELGDLDHLLIALRRKPMREATGRRAYQVVGDFMKSLFDGSKAEVWRWNDWRPFTRELRLWLGSDDSS